MLLHTVLLFSIVCPLYVLLLIIPIISYEFSLKCSTILPICFTALVYLTLNCPILFLLLHYYFFFLLGTFSCDSFFWVFYNFTYLFHCTGLPYIELPYILLLYNFSLFLPFSHSSSITIIMFTRVVLFSIYEHFFFYLCHFIINLQTYFSSELPCLVMCPLNFSSTTLFSLPLPVFHSLLHSAIHYRQPPPNTVSVNQRGCPRV